MDFVAIDRVGLELEGGWNTTPAGASFHHDGSVRGIVAPIRGEMVSAPIASWTGIAEWLTAAYPTEHNSSCGFHAHVSFKKRSDYARLMTPAFFDYFGRRMQAWGERMRLPRNHLFWNRLAGFNHYCSKTFRPDAQAFTRGKTGVRYSQLNYCFRLHGTIECRLFPVFKTKKIALAALEELCTIYEDWLRDAANHIDISETVDDLA